MLLAFFWHQIMKMSNRAQKKIKTKSYWRKGYEEKNNEIPSSENKEMEELSSQCQVKSKNQREV